MRTCYTLLALYLFAMIADTCPAQGMFGKRELGQSVSKRVGPGSTGAAPGTVGSGRRFLRDERTAADFVGSTASGGGAAGFVGGNSAVTAAISAVSGLVEEARPPLNRPRSVRPTGLYAERLTLSSGLLDSSTVQANATPLSPSLLSLIQTRSVTIEVSAEGRSATLRGAVPSEHDRQTTELLVMLEPGIQKVENALTVDPTLPPIQRLQRRSRLPKSN